MQKKLHYLILLVSIIFSINCFSQNPNPSLFQTWYLVSVQNTDLAQYYSTTAVTPSITPILTISNDLSYTGTGACNTFTGSFAGTTTDYFWNPGTFSASEETCSTQSQSNFEGSYFYFMQSSGSYYISSNSNGMVLLLNTPLMGMAVFQNYPLATTDFKLEQIAIYPNPVSSAFHLSAENANISKIQVINSLGQNVKTIDTNFETVDISELSSGMYILKIDTESGSVNKKIIKG